MHHLIAAAHLAAHHSQGYLFKIGGHKVVATGSEGEAIIVGLIVLFVFIPIAIRVSRLYRTPAR
jgi:hypothetical protein